MMAKLDYKPSGVVVDYSTVYTQVNMRFEANL
jgi:hypothetical protein